MIQRILYTLGRTPSWVVWLLFTSIMTVAADAVLDNTIAVGLLYLPCLLFLAALSNSEYLTGKFVARRGVLSLSAVLVGLLLCLVLSWFFPYVSSESSLAQQGPGNPLPKPALTQDFLLFSVSLGISRELLSFLVIGATIGAVLRNVTSRVMDLTILGKKRLGQSILLTAAWTTGILIFPWDGLHMNAATWYVVGITSGVLLSRSFRLRIVKATAAFRRIHEVFDAWPRGAEASKEEVDALKLLAKGRQLPFFRFTKLRNKLEDWRGTEAYSNRIALISAALHRLEGNYHGAVTEAQLAKEPKNSREDLHLLLLKTLSLYELEGEPEGDRILSKIMETDLGKECPLATATLAARQAERSLESLESNNRDNAPLALITEALDLRREVLTQRLGPNASPDDVLGSFVVRYTEIGIPLTAPFLLDILGYCMIVAGYTEEGKIILERCIQLDRTYSSAYLHLGDYFLFRSKLKGSRSRIKHEHWHARACYFAAETLAGRTSHVRRRARLRLSQIEAYTE